MSTITRFTVVGSSSVTVRLGVLSPNPDVQPAPVVVPAMAPHASPDDAAALAPALARATSVPKGSVGPTERVDPAGYVT